MPGLKAAVLGKSVNISGSAAAGRAQTSEVNGKVKARLKVAADIDAAAAIAAAKADPAVAAALEGKQLVKEIYVKGRLVNLAVKG